MCIRIILNLHTYKSVQLWIEGKHFHYRTLLSAVLGSRSLFIFCSFCSPTNCSLYFRLLSLFVKVPFFSSSSFLRLFRTPFQRDFRYIVLTLALILYFPSSLSRISTLRLSLDLIARSSFPTYIRSLPTREISSGLYGGISYSAL